MPANSKIAVSALMAAVLALAGCSSKPTGTGSPRYDKAGPLPIGGGVYKVGKPYQIAGNWYYPKEEPDYDRTGIASWYGPKFHRRQTANGEWFDMNRLTAAHPTLPLPSYARVTNLRNGRSLIVRVNDRGPYARNRIIDLSKRSASLLGFIGTGTTRVRVRYLSPAPLNGDDPAVMAQNRQLIRMAGGASAPLTTATTRRKGDRLTIAPIAAMPAAPGRRPGAGQRYFVQVAAFSRLDNAQIAQNRLTDIGVTRIIPAQVAGRTFHRVRLGPFRSGQEADQVRSRTVTAGFSGARLVKTE